MKLCNKGGCRMRKLLKNWDDPDHGYGPAVFHGPPFQPMQTSRKRGKNAPRGPLTASGKTWRVLAKKHGTLRDIGDGSLKRLRP